MPLMYEITTAVEYTFFPRQLQRNVVCPVWKARVASDKIIKDFLRESDVYWTVHHCDN